ncbi:MAG: NAD(P)H-dependent glycerol-3-phosphate dehydrogenase [Tissierellales bacterium]|jgi:glycerol-3-phosphate dehydrogenase (NAD(P)+)|nr:NAD(P)H-dependent glycerol-3-phosphate dehydrogenase [Tissierellales bacterium]
MNNKIGILGGGSWGTALAILLAKKGIEVNLWVRNKDKADLMKTARENVDYLAGVIIPEDVNITENLEKAVEGSEILVLAVPTHAVRNLCTELNGKIVSNQIFVNVAKGIEISSLKRISEIVEEYFPENEFVALSGPTHAEEVSKDMPTTIVAACENESIAEKIQDIFMTPKFRVYTNTDLMGVELGGALKNVIALGAGIADGLGYGDNSLAALMNRGITEIARLGEKMGANRMTFTGLSGIGDLIVTCTSKHSRNRSAGVKIGKGMNLEEAVESIGMVVEGVKTAKSVHELMKKYEVEMPICENIYEVLYENLDPKHAVIRLMMRDKKDELEHMKESESFGW